MKIFLSLLIVTLTLLFNTNSYAEPGRGITKQEAANIATDEHPGRVLGVKRKKDVYRVKTLSKGGKVRVIRVDATSGKIRAGKKTRK